MYITFNSIKLHNFFSFEDAEINLSENGFVLVEGQNKNVSDNAESNGAGKSTIFEALSWVLTGETIRGTKEVKRRGENDGCYVEIEFSIDNNHYKILRSKDHKEHKTNLFIYINGENKSGKGIRDTSELLKQYLPDLTPSLINSVILLGQGLPMRFTNNTPSGRKEVLERLSKSDFMIEDLKERIDARTKGLNDALQKIKDDDIKLSTRLDILSALISNNKNTLDSIGSVDELIDKKKELEGKKSDAKNAFDSVSEKMSLSQSVIDELRDEYDKANSALVDAANADSNALSAIKTECQKKLEDNESGLAQLTNSAFALQQEIIRLDNVSDVCPTCGQKLPNVHKIDTTDKKEELKKLNAKINSIKEKSNEIKREYANKYVEKESEQNKSRALLEEKVRNCKTKISDETRNYNALSSSSVSISSAMLSIDGELLKVESEISSYNDTKSRLEKEISDANDSISEINEKILYNNTERQSLQNKLDIQSKFSTAVKRDFRGYLLSGVIDYIDKKAKEYCEYIFNTRNISFKLDGNNIDISYNDKQYESLSGGEKQRIDLIIQMSIRDMLCKYLSFSCNILVLDEITDNLDRLGCEKIISFITDKLSDINSIYIISHRGELEIPYDNELVIIKEEDGISRVA